MVQEIPQIRLDHPLRVGSALSNDELSRSSFARSITQVLERVTSEAGLVLSLEGSWGSGKTSLLAMVEEVLQSNPTPRRPVIVHFNPWLIGDREALLRQFLAVVTKEVQLADRAADGKQVAKKISAYSKAFDVVKLVPGAEPWATIIKSVVDSVGNATESVADYKAPDIEDRKLELEAALRKYSKRIIILIDDIDRLFPAEVFEMVRIVKAVGDLPNVGYVLSWDPSYVSAALEKLSVPYAEKYLDKVVQVRLPVPPMSYSMRMEIMEKGLRGLPHDAQRVHFPNGDDRLGLLFYNGLSDLIETPRDVVRLYDLVQTIEPGLRGEIHLADIIGLAALMIKAPSVYELLHRFPEAFVGRQPGGSNFLNKEVETIASYEDARDEAIKYSSSPKAVKRLVEWIFPKVCLGSSNSIYDDVTFVEGHLGHPERLLVALQLSMRLGDVSLVSVQQYLLHSAKRKEIAANLQVDSCVDFLRNLGEVAQAFEGNLSIDKLDAGHSIAQLVDERAFSQRARSRKNVWEMRISRIGLGVIAKIVANDTEQNIRNLVDTIISDSSSLSIAAEILLSSFARPDAKGDDRLKAEHSRKDTLISVFVNNIDRAAGEGDLYALCSPEIILWAAALLAPRRCKRLIESLKRHDENLDLFVETHLRAGFDSVKGQMYGLPKDIALIEAYIPLVKLRDHAAKRLDDAALDFPTRAAWQAVIEGGHIYGKDGSPAET